MINLIHNCKSTTQLQTLSKCTNVTYKFGRIKANLGFQEAFKIYRDSLISKPKLPKSMFFKVSLIIICRIYAVLCKIYALKGRYSHQIYTILCYYYFFSVLYKIILKFHS